MSRRKLAEYLGVDPAQVTRFFKSARPNLPPDRLAKLAHALDWPIGVLVLRLAEARQFDDLEPSTIEISAITRQRLLNYQRDKELYMAREATPPEPPEAPAPEAPGMKESVKIDKAAGGLTFSLKQGGTRIKVAIDLQPADHTLLLAGEIWREAHEFLIAIEKKIKEVDDGGKW